MEMKLTNIEHITSFLEAVDKCQGSVWLESPQGDKFNLKSAFSRYVSIGALLSNHGDELELFCGPDDEHCFYKWFHLNPEVLQSGRSANED
jgi:hypothetical protein